MATLRQEKIVQVPAEKAWAMLRNVAMPQVLFAGVLVDSVLEGDIRTITFANGMIVQERIIDIDETNRRVAYTVLGDLFEHHSAYMVILPDGDERCRFVWVCDFLPNERMELMKPLVEQGARALVLNLEASDGTDFLRNSQI